MKLLKFLCLDTISYQEGRVQADALKKVWQILGTFTPQRQAVFVGRDTQRQVAAPQYSRKNAGASRDIVIQTNTGHRHWKDAKLVPAGSF